MQSVRGADHVGELYEAFGFPKFHPQASVSRQRGEEGTQSDFRGVFREITYIEGRTRRILIGGSDRGVLEAVGRC